MEPYNLIFNTELVGFGKKIELFRKILQKINYEINGKNREEKLMEALIFINSIRNKVAHWNWSQTKTEQNNYYLRNPRKEEIIKLDETLLNIVDDI